MCVELSRLSCQPYRYSICRLTYLFSDKALSVYLSSLRAYERDLSSRKTGRSARALRRRSGRPREPAISPCRHLGAECSNQSTSVRVTISIPSWRHTADGVTYSSLESSYFGSDEVSRLRYRFLAPAIRGGIRCRTFVTPMWDRQLQHVTMYAQISGYCVEDSREIFPDLRADGCHQQAAIHCGKCDSVRKNRICNLERM